MANERLVIEVTAKGARVVQGEIAKIGTTARTANTGVGALKAALATLGVGLALRATVNTIRDFSQEISTVAAVTGATGAQFQALTDRARELGATTRFTATAAAEGLTLLGRAGFSVAESIDTVDDTLRLAQAGGLGLAEAASITAQALRGFRLETDQAGRVADVLAKAANSANTDVTQLGEAIKFVAPVAAGTGVSLETTTAAISKLSDAGLQASLAGAGLRRVLGDLEAPNKNQLKILQQLGVAAEDVKLSNVGLSAAIRTLRDAGLDTAASFQLFGDRGAAVAEILTSTIDEVDALDESLQNAEGTAAEVARVMDDNLNGAMFRAKSALEAIILAFGKIGAEQALKTFFEKLAIVFRAVADRIEDVVRVMGAAGLLGAILLVKAAIVALGTAIAANPIGAIVTVLAAATAAAVFFADEIKVSGDSVASLRDVFDETLSVGIDLLNSFIENWTRGFRFMEDEAGAALQGTQISFRTLALGAAQTVDDILNFITGLVLVIKEIPSAIRNAFQGKSLIEFILNPAGGLQIGRQLGDVFATGFEGSAAVDAVNRVLAGAEERARDRAKKLALDTSTGAQATVAQGVFGPANAPRGGGAAAADPLAEINAQLDRQNQLLRLSRDEREVQIALEETLNELRKAGIEFLMPLELEQLETKIRANQELENQVEKTSRLQSQIEALESQVGTVDLAFEALVLGSVSEFTDALFAFDGNFFGSLKRGLSDLTAEIAKAIVKMLLLRAISGAFGGSSFGNFLGIGGNAIGGAVRAGEPTIVGERRPELFIPQESGRIVPNVNVNAQAGPTMVAVVKTEQEAEELILSRGGKRAVLQVINENPKAAGGR